MDWERILWVSSLAVALLVTLFHKGRSRVAILCVLFGTFMYGYLTMAERGGYEQRYLLIILGLIAVAFATGVIWLLYCRAKNKPQKLAIVLLTIAVASGYWALPMAEAHLPDSIMAWLPVSQTEAGDDLQVHFIDVGQGDAVLVKAPQANMLIDAGSRSAGETVTSYLQAQGVTELDLVIATHPHEDHIGGLIEVLGQFTVGEVLDPGVVHTSQTFERYLDVIDDNDIPFTEARVGLSRELGPGIKVDVLHPEQPSSGDLNNASVVARLIYGDVAFLFTGDAEVPAEEQMLDRGNRVRADVLKAGHHGSRTSSAPEFLDAVLPRYAVMTAGQGNTYGHPHQDILDAFSAADVQVFRSDLHGNIVFITDGLEIEVSTDYSADVEAIFQAP